jgi:hypothetical protein
LTKIPTLENPSTVLGAKNSATVPAAVESQAKISAPADPVAIGSGLADLASKGQALPEANVPTVPTATPVPTVKGSTGKLPTGSFPPVQAAQAATASSTADAKVSIDSRAAATDSLAPVKAEEESEATEVKLDRQEFFVLF